MGKTSQIAQSFPRLYPVVTLNLSNLPEKELIPLIPTLNKNNNLSKEKGFFKKRGVD